MSQYHIWKPRDGPRYYLEPYDECGRGHDSIMASGRGNGGMVNTVSMFVFGFGDVLCLYVTDLFCLA
jgi:hypothetical protein